MKQDPRGAGLRDPGQRGRAGTLLAFLALAFAGGCTITPERIKRIETENELLREEIRVVKEKCSYYKTLEVQVDEDEEGSADSP